jgi:hypothetical protein
VKRLLAIGALVLAVSVPSVAHAVVTQGTIKPNRSAKGIRLGMSKAQVLTRLGSPVYQNQNGYMQYGPDDEPVIFDVYLDTSTNPDRVRLLGVSGAGFCLADGGPCLFEKGGVGKLKVRYGSAMKLVTLESGEKVYRLTAKYGGCDVFTDFTPAKLKPGAKIIMVFIGYLSGGYC